MKDSSSYISKAACLLTIAVGSLVLVGWFFNIPDFTTLFFGAVTIKFNLAICILLSGISLYLLDSASISNPKKKLAFLCAGLVLIIGLLTLSQYIFGWNLGIDELLWKTNPLAEPASMPGRMTLFAAIIISLGGIILLLLRNRKYLQLAQAVILLTILMMVLIIVYDISGMNLFINPNPVSLPLVITFIILITGVFYSFPLSHLKFFFQKKIAAFFTLVSFILVLIFFGYKINSLRTIDTHKWIEHTNEVIFQSQQILTELAEMQSGIRGFLLNADENYLPLFSSSADSLGSFYILRLKTLTKDNPAQLTRIDSLEKLIDFFIKSGKEIISLNRTTSLDEQKIKALMGEGKKTIDHSREIISAIQYEENLQLANRKIENSRNFQNSSRLTTFLQIAIFLLLMAALFIIYKNTRLRNMAESEKMMNATLEKRVEEKTKELIVAELQFRKIMDNSMTGSVIFGFDWKYKYVNDTFVTHTHYSREELLGYTLMEKYPGIEQTEIFKTIQRCMNERVITTIQDEFTFPDGTKRWFDLSYQPMAEGVVGFTIDITERKNSEDALAKSENYLRTIIQTEPECVKLLGINSELQDMNPSGLAMIEADNLEQVKGKSLLGIIDAPYREAFAALTKNVFNDESGNMQFEITGLKGTHRWLDTHAVPLKNTEGKVISLLGVTRDITDRKKAEENQKQYADELYSSNTELERFAYVASHDLQEPLRMVSSFLNLVEEELNGQLNETTREYIHFAMDGAARMKILVKDLLDYSRVGTNKEDFSEINLNEVMQYVTHLLEEDIYNNKAVITFEPLPVIKANKTLINQLFVNLVGNALKYHDDKELKIEVGSTEKSDHWIFYVKDNGIGIDPKFFDKIFIIFQRLHNKSEYSGTGIGLAICKKIVESHHGKIWVESVEGKGSSFYFSIPKISK